MVGRAASASLAPDPRSLFPPPLDHPESGRSLVISHVTVSCQTLGRQSTHVSLREGGRLGQLRQRCERGGERDEVHTGRKVKREAAADVQEKGREKEKK